MEIWIFIKSFAVVMIVFALCCMIRHKRKKQIDELRKTFGGLQKLYETLCKIGEDNDDFKLKCQEFRTQAELFQDKAQAFIGLFFQTTEETREVDNMLTEVIQDETNIRVSTPEDLMMLYHVQIFCQQAMRDNEEFINSAFN